MVNGGGGMTIRYLRDKSSKPIGCVVAIEDNRMGWSLCCKKDVFTKKMARKIAFGRAVNGTSQQVPYKLLELWNKVATGE